MLGASKVGILSLEVTELILTNEGHEKTWLGPLRKGLPANAPTAVFVDFSPKDEYDEWRVQFKYTKSVPPGDTVRDDSPIQGKSSPDAS